MLLKEEEMIRCKGGAKFSLGSIFIISVISSFFFGIIDGQIKLK